MKWNELEIYISTRGRASKKLQSTWGLLPKNSNKKFVVVPEEKKWFVKNYGKDCCLVLPKSLRGISDSRHWIMEQARGPYVIHCDEDLVFNIRDDELKIKKATTKQIKDMLVLLLSWFEEGIAWVGVSTRAGNNRVTEDYLECTRSFAFYGYNKDIIKKEGIRFDRLPLMHDFDVTLQLLEHGYKNRVSFRYCHNEIGGSNAPGGCSIFRTPKLIKKAAIGLAKLHPGVVKVKAKISKSSWQGMEKKKGTNGTVRTDVNIQWKKAYKPRERKKSGVTDFLK